MRGLLVDPIPNSPNLQTVRIITDEILGVKGLPPRSDQDKISPFNTNTISTR